MILGGSYDDLEGKRSSKKVVCHTNEKLAEHWVDTLVDTMSDEDYPIEVRSLSRTLK